MEAGGGGEEFFSYFECGKNATNGKRGFDRLQRKVLK